jgi:hypothetical protein
MSGEEAKSHLLISGKPCCTERPRQAESGKHTHSVTTVNKLIGIRANLILVLRANNSQVLVGGDIPGVNGLLRLTLPRCALLLGTIITKFSPVYFQPTNTPHFDAHPAPSVLHDTSTQVPICCGAVPRQLTSHDPPPHLPTADPNLAMFTTMSAPF